VSGARFAGKVALVTGAASGIGLATVEAFAAEGARVLAADVQDEKGAALAARFPGQVVYRRCDVTDEAAIKAAVEAAVEAFGGLDIVFNNAGSGGAMAGIADIAIADWKQTLDLLLTSVVAGTRHAVPHLIARGGGAIINTASIAGLQAGWGPIAYSTAKAAVIHFTRCAAAELSAHHIRINAICPGLIATSIFGASLGLPREQADQMAAMVAAVGGPAQPLGRPGRPEDIAAMVLHLASDAGGFITGTHVVVDGGITIGPRHAWDPETLSPLAAAMGMTLEQTQALVAAQKAGGS
jgi:NAD(P)-dependent dehydrogenase (short-subunit alcohol dehydrogenase family)